MKRTPEEQHEENIKDPDFLIWYLERPRVIQALYHKYPYHKYRIKVGAPYGITAPGSIVYLESYREDGEIGVIIYAEDKLPAGIQYERGLCKTFNKDPELMLKQNVFVHVDPKWLEPVFDEVQKITMKYTKEDLLAKLILILAGGMAIQEKEHSEPVDKMVSFLKENIDALAEQLSEMDLPADTIELAEYVAIFCQQKMKETGPCNNLNQYD